MTKISTTSLNGFHAAFLAEVKRLGGTIQGAGDWLTEAVNIGLDDNDTAESLAWTCVDDELSNLDPETDGARIKELRASLAASRAVDDVAYGLTLAEWLEAAGGLDNPRVAGIEYRDAWRAGEDPDHYREAR
jgi:hypothetical protein